MRSNIELYVLDNKNNRALVSMAPNEF